MLAAKNELFTRPSGGYTIARSVRLRSSASAYFNRTPASASNRKTFTWSGWVKRGTLSSSVVLFGADGTTTAGTGTLFYLYFDSDTLYIGADNTSGLKVQTSAVYRDPSAWYHVVMAVDTTQATSSNRVKLYVNGVQVTAFSTATYPTQNREFNVNNTAIHTIGKWPSSSDFYFDGYLTEINFIDGQALTPSSFGETDSITGVWKPKAYSGTYGTNGFELNFSDNSNNTAATIGKDYSGNGNNWTPNNISVTTGATYDSMTDVPTLTSATAANYPVLNPLSPFHTYVNITNGNLTATGNGSGNTDTVCTTFGSPSTSIYWEYTCVTVYSGGSYGRTGVITTYPTATGQTPGEIASLGGFGWRADGYLSQNGSNTGGLVPSFTTGDVLGFALNIASGTCALYKNNSLQYTVTGLSTTATYFPATAEYNGSVGAFNFGQQGFKYTPPTGFVALNTYNLPASTIKNGAAYMAATLYTGNLTGQSITNTASGASFQPDLVWVKSRSAATDNKLTDSVRGATKALISNSSAAETTDLTGVTAINSNGFTVGVSTVYNNTGVTYVGWQWKAGGTSASNTNGSITSTVSVGATQGFSVVTYTGTGANATVGHGLGVAPSMIIIKARVTAFNWAVWHTSLGGGDNALQLNSTNGVTSAFDYWNGANTSSVFTLGTDFGVNKSAETYVAYCFAAVAGYSAFGSYTGNGSADGAFVYTGFRPRWIMIKSTGVEDWIVHDTSRNPYNASNLVIYPNSAQAEDNNPTYRLIDILSNGFKMRSSQGQENGSGITYVYAAFGENPLKYANAR